MYGPHGSAYRARARGGRPARVNTDGRERREVLARVARAWGRSDLDVMVRDSPLVEVTLDDPPGP